jgi:hypothetical protein
MMFGQILLNKWIWHGICMECLLLYLIPIDFMKGILKRKGSITPFLKATHGTGVHRSLAQYSCKIVYMWQEEEYQFDNA